MSWTFNGVRLYTQGFNPEHKQIIARLHPQNSATVLHRWGKESEVLTMDVFVLTSGDLSSLEALMADDTAYELSSPEGVVGNYVLATFNPSREMSNWHKFFDRPSLPTDTPLYKATLVLYPDDS